MTIDESVLAGDADKSLGNPDAIESAARSARASYEAVHGLYEDFARSVGSVLRASLSASEVVVLSVTPRVKAPDSFERKAARPSQDDPTKPKYTDPLNQITDKAAVRVITYFLSVLKDVSRVVHEQFEVIEELNKSSDQPEQVGYQSIHYLVKYPTARTTWLDYRRFDGLIAEIQVRTILQHAWAEIEHDIQYKALEALPAQIKRRFAALAGLIEIADREFQAIEDENKAIEVKARQNVDLGKLDEVEITPDAVRAYLDKRFGVDRRMSQFSYRWTAHTLVRLGFSNLAEVDKCIAPYNPDRVSRTLHGSRQGQITRFEDVLLAGMGKALIIAHPLHSTNDWWSEWKSETLNKMREKGIEIKSYLPPGYPESHLQPSEPNNEDPQAPASSISS
ncbi:hypothetical protein AB0C42_03470 [Micromonospora taraxaci]|uniref:GTP pyrophosphokinase n=1 Tax=Micromonospora taraxaci TaxID=1316803 RepID=UPI0033D55A71